MIERVGCVVMEASPMKKLLLKYSMYSALVIGCFFNVVKSDVYAEDIEYKNMEQMMGSIKLEKQQLEIMVDKMVESGRISAEEAVEAKRALAGMKEDDLEHLKTKAIATVKSQQLLNP